MFEWLYTICKISRKKRYLREKQRAESRLKRETVSIEKPVNTP